MGVVAIACVVYNGNYYWAMEFGASSLIGTETEAYNGDQTVSVDVATSLISQVNSVTLTDENITLEEGSTVAAPQIAIEVLTGTSKRVKTLYVNPLWTVTNKDVLAIDAVGDSDVLKGVAAGTATISTSLTLLGTEYSETADVTVTHGTATKTEEVAATCLADGMSAYYTCSTCGKTFSDEAMTNEVSLADLVIEATGHTPETDEAVAATCTENGLTAGSHCSACGEIMVAQYVIPATGHMNIVTDAAVAATCTENGLTEGSHCEDCGEVIVAQTVIPATGHTPVALEAVEATCTSTGLTEGSHCLVCDTVLVEQEVIPTVDHTWDSGTVTLKPGCEMTGEMTYTCTVCGATKTETINSTGHEYVGVETTPATCEEDGVITYTCANCNDSYTEAIPAKGHDWDEGEVTTVASCSGAGVMLYTCNTCGTEKTVAIDATEHTVEIDEAVEATCYSTGLTEGNHCSVCGAIIVAQEVVEKTAHTYDDGVVTTAATCTTNGVITYTCSVCGDTYTETIAAGHTNIVTDAYVAPTCTETGLTEGRHCEDCGEVILAQTVIEATGHVPVTDAAVAATCTTTGLTEGSHCSVCGEVLTAQEIISATGHNAVKVEAVAATETTAGNIEYWYCAACDTYFSDEALTEEITKEDTIIAALGVTEPDNTTTPSGTETPAPTIDGSVTDTSTDGTEATATPAPTDEAEATSTPTSEAGTTVTVTPVATATATTGTNNVQTGDNSMIGLWLTIMSLAAAGLAGIAVVQKKGKKSVK